MVAKEDLLTSTEMARFVADGFLRFDELVPNELNEAVCAEMERGEIPRVASGQPLSGLWQEQAIGQVIRLPKIQGIIQSLVGTGPLYDHHAVHTVQAKNEHGQIWHADAIIDTRIHFDIQLFYFAHDTPREMGGTMFLPGSQYRRISESDIGRYQNFVGQIPMVCKAGTVAVAHHGIWHCAQPNLTGKIRHMFKLRLNPMVRQKLLWNTDDIRDESIPGLLSADHRWYGNESRIEVVNRIKMWRFLTDDEQYDVSYWMSRIENTPDDKLQAA